MLYWLGAEWAALGGCEKITLRAALAALLSFGMALALGPRLIGWLQARFREPIKSASPLICELHRDKQWTPTMGGLFIVAGVLGSMALFTDWTNPYLPAALVATCGLAGIGFIDDWIKLSTHARGLSARKKMLGQVIVSAIAAVLLYRAQSNVPQGLQLSTGGLCPPVELGGWFIPLAILVIVGASNAVNLTDGLDGLAGGCLLFSVGGMAMAVYASGHAEWAAYLRLSHIPRAGEMVVVAGGVLGGVLGFLWFNCHPASVFMGDTGALPLGGLLGVLALVARQELLLVFVGGVFVAEALSVILQVGYFRWRSKRLLRCAPLHHHFQFLGWPENKIVVRFWIAAALCAIGGVASLKLGARDDLDARASTLRLRVAEGQAAERLAAHPISIRPSLERE